MIKYPKPFIIHVIPLILLVDCVGVCAELPPEPPLVMFGRLDAQDGSGTIVTGELEVVLNAGGK